MKSKIIIERLNKESQKEILTLQEKISASLEDKSVYVASSEKEIDEILEGEGIVLGARVDERLVAYFMTWFPRQSEENLGRDMGLSRDELNKVVHFESVGVDPSYRGLRLQQQLMEALLCQVEKMDEIKYMLATVSPYNPYSLKNFLEQGFFIKKIKVKYGGVLRMILFKEKKTKEGRLFENTLEIKSQDIEKQKEVIDKGYQGISLRMQENGCIIVYAKR